MATTKINQVLRELAHRLEATSDSSIIEARVLVQHITERSAAWVLAHADELLTNEQVHELERLAGRLIDGEPLPYLTGHQEFFGLDFEINPNVLIPRPETELLVEHALAWLKVHPDQRQAVDVGTGSGCIAVSLAKEVPDLQVTAIDISPAALHLARINAQKHSVHERISFLQSNLLISNIIQYNLLTANLPYIPSETLKSLDVYRREPALALDGGEDGLDLIRCLLAQLPAKMLPHGLALLEIESGQGEAVLHLSRSAFPGGNVKLVQDLSGKDRLVIIET